MLSTTTLLAFTALLSTTTAYERTKDFTGLGQIRTVYIGSNHEDLGCLTATGQWTVDESQCGTFVTARVAENSYNNQFHLSSTKAGACGIDVATFKCGGGVKWSIFGTFGKGVPVDGKEVLRYGQYGVLATNAPDSPPSLNDEPLAIHFYSGAEKGKWVWLGWKALDEEHDAE